MPTILQVDHLTKRFGALAAVDDLSFSVEQGETLGIAGPNGAGKTTLFDLISGHAHATAGVIRLGSAEIQSLPAHQVRQLGIARTYQVAPAFGSQTVLAHVVLASHFGDSRGYRLGLRFDGDRMMRAVRAAQQVGLGDRLGECGEALSTFDRKRVMLAAALVSEPRILMLDEPVAGLTDDETDEVVSLVRSLQATGMTIMLVEHVMRVLMPISTRVLIMHQGAKLFEGLPLDAQVDPEVVRLYLGTGVTASPSQVQAG